MIDDDLHNQWFVVTMAGRTLLVVCLSAVCAAVADDHNNQEYREVNTTQGPVRGYKEPGYGYYAFMNIPYATAPTGTNRFKAPLPPPVWMQPMEAVDKRIICPQATLPIPVIPVDRVMQEDCLIANVYVPATQEKNLPVVFYVHGGAFQIGYGDWFVAKQLIADNNIIYVSFNYRLGIHGFLSLGTEDIPGNAGMKDQVAALRWVKKNIARFGGNPDDITIHGSSAGSAAVDLLMLSKSTEGLFNKVISESGASIAPWSIQNDPLKNAKDFAKSFTDVDDIYALEDFYKNISFDLLTSDPFYDRPDSTFLFSPCVERATGEEVFMDKSPVDILKSGNYNKVPLLYGFSNMEGLFRIDFFAYWKQLMNEMFSDFFPPDLKFDSEEEKEKVAQIVKEFYFGDKPVSENNILSYVDFFTDIIFAYPMMRTVKLHIEAGHDQIYLYQYSFTDEKTPLVPHTNVRGATHCAQTTAVFGAAAFFTDDMKTEKFMNVSSIVRKLWSNFIKTGKPTRDGSSLPSWPPVGKGWSPYMSINTELHLEGPLQERRMRFWDDIYSKYYRDPVPAPAPPARRVLNDDIDSLHNPSIQK